MNEKLKQYLAEKEKHPPGALRADDYTTVFPLRKGIIPCEP